MSEILWWAYIHENGTLNVKRYFSKADIEEADSSPFVQEIVGPFEAESRQAAEIEAKKQLGVD